jgi:hypothetical protein
VAGGGKGALLLQANYGAGKSHLLRFIKEEGLEQGFAVSMVPLDCKAGIRFNRMDQVVGAVCRNISVPGSPNEKGIRPFFDRICTRAEEAFWRRFTNEGKWDYSNLLRSPALYVALRAWVKGSEDMRERVVDWLCQPWLYRTQRKLLHHQLVYRLQHSFREPRSERQFYIQGIFEFHVQGYAQSWALLHDLHFLSVAAGLKGLIVLVDEFEDVITNLNNIAYQEDAFWNLFKFWSDPELCGLTVFAVTPAFASKCKTLLMQKGRWNRDYSSFERLPTFHMSPLSGQELGLLVPLIAGTHSIAYGWNPETLQGYEGLGKVVEEAASVPVQDRARQTIKAIVGSLDCLFQDGR